MLAVSLLTGALLLSAGACGAGGGETPAGGKPEVVASIYPLQWLSEQVAGPDAKVVGLTAPGVEPHDLELGAHQVAELEDATLTVYVRGVQPAVDEAVAEDRAFDAATAVKTIPAGGHAEEGEEGHEHEVSYDPHLWLDPSRLATVATALGDRLATADPAHAQGYRERAARTAAELRALDQELTKGLENCASRTMVTAHEAFGYLADRYRLKQIGITLDPETEPSPARVDEVARLARAEKVNTIFTESLVSPKVAEVLAKEVGARTGVLDPLETRPEGGDYLSAMRANLTALRSALGCA
ncbi:metal ABC transporter substrate-binding protein [Nonomuraea cavernae]|uniref:Zinc ABC transporter substrate-binding protein n=1 Tax=Nonomuraea cavernae TaxID=2045107 RepID=A0A917YTQ9_9ACTN|nr:metal ABC transporter substrate-binding protein [Nonomuraea cavernae]MCA2185423.1 metal ABC transporter substrate-binding protein [Nonomuraea cavernae]GGO66426.1 zinc ABC transporter substrate-binding protein [Nonomuraea cavernae]